MTVIGVRPGDDQMCTQHTAGSGAVLPHTGRSTQQSFVRASHASMRLEEMQDEHLASYREAVRRRLQELMLRENYPPGHSLVVATGHHLDMSSAVDAAERYSAPSLAHFYQGCDLFYSVPARSATPPSPDQVAQVASANLAKVTI